MLYLSEMDPRAAELARARGLGLELIEFCAPERLEDEERIAQRSKELRNFAAASLHAPYAELFPCAVDPDVRSVARRRLLRAGEVCARLGVRRMIAHSGCAPRLYFPEWYVPRSIEFWRGLLRDFPKDVELLLENVLDPEPAELAAIIDGVGDPRLGACLDVGHANVYSPRPVSDWIERLGTRIRHVHLHDNGGERDEHAPLGEGSMDIPALLAALRAWAPNADWCVESRDAAECLRYLESRRLLEVGAAGSAREALEHDASANAAAATENHVATQRGEGEAQSRRAAASARLEGALGGVELEGDSSRRARYESADAEQFAAREGFDRNDKRVIDSADAEQHAAREGFDRNDQRVIDSPDAEQLAAREGFDRSAKRMIVSNDAEQFAAREGFDRNAKRAIANADTGQFVAREGFDPAVIAIPLPDEAAMAAAEARQRILAKPPGSLGVLEEISIRFAGITGQERNRARRRRLLVFAADNGVTAEGVSSAPKSVTLAQTRNLARGMTGAATLARHFGAELRVYDVGVDAPGPLGGGVAHRRIANGTRNLAIGPAMTREEALAALRVGREAAAEAKRDGMEIIGIGEMGIGNTTTSAAMLSALMGLPAAETVGRGGGVNDAGFARKREIVDSAVARLNGSRDALEVLAEAGGFDIAAMCGAFIGAAERRLPAVIDGYISVVAALCAERLAPGCRNYMFASHASWERGYARAVEALGLKPMLALEMRLGEGSGCPIAFELIDAALMLLNEMATFEEARIDDGYLTEIRENARLRR